MGEEGPTMATAALSRVAEEEPSGDAPTTRDALKEEIKYLDYIIMFVYEKRMDTDDHVACRWPWFLFWATYAYLHWGIMR